MCICITNTIVVNNQHQLTSMQTASVGLQQKCKKEHEQTVLEGTADLDNTTHVGREVQLPLECLTPNPAP